MCCSWTLQQLKTNLERVENDANLMQDNSDVLLNLAV